MGDNEIFFRAEWDRMHPPGCKCASCKDLALSASRSAAKRTRRGTSATSDRAPKRGPNCNFSTPATVELTEVYGLPESDSQQFNLSDLPTCGEGGRTEMPEPLHQDEAEGAAERPPRGTAQGDSASGQTQMQMDDHDYEMDVDHTNSDSGVHTVRRSATHHSSSRRHHAASESRGPINIYEASAADIINMGKEQLDSKSRRKRKKRHKTKAAKQMAKTRTANTPSRDTLRLAAMAGDEPHRHCCSCNRMFGQDEARRWYPHVLPMTTLCEPCAAKPEVLVKLGLAPLAHLFRPGDAERPFQWDDDKKLVVAARCPRCDSCYDDALHGSEVAALSAFGAVPFKLLLIDDGGMRVVEKNQFVHWTCNRCTTAGQQDCDVPCTVVAAATLGLWPVIAYTQPGSKDLDGPLMQDDTMVFMHRSKATFLGRLRIAGRMSFECLHDTLRALTLDSGRDDLSLSKRMRSALLRSVTLLRSVEAGLRHRVKDELKDENGTSLHLSSCLICSKLDDEINPKELGGCCGICIDCTLKGASKNVLAPSTVAADVTDSMDEALRADQRLLLRQSDIEFSEQLTKRAQEKARDAAASARAATAVDAVDANTAGGRSAADSATAAGASDGGGLDGAAGVEGGAAQGGQASAAEVPAHERQAAAEASAQDGQAAAEAPAQDGDAQAGASVEGCYLGERFHSCHSDNMTPGIDAKMEDMKPKRTTGIGVCTHLFIFIAGLLVSPKHECYLLIQTLAEEIAYQPSFRPIKISDPAWPEALRGVEYLFAYYDIACRRVPSGTPWHCVVFASSCFVSASS